jgi:PKD repeat protein
MVRTTRTLTAAAIFLALSACTVHKQSDAPALTGPSDNATSLSVTVTPDIITQDGASQSLATVTAFGPNGQPLRSLALRAEIIADGISADFGTLSARNVVTDSSGRASVTYTAPPAPVFNVDNGVSVAIRFTPLGTDAVNANPREATIRLVPPGVVGPGNSPLRPDFTPPTATVGNATVFQATVVDAAGADATGQVTSFAWSFGDGGSASGRTVTHTYTSPGSFPVSLTITDTLGRTQRVSHTVTTGQGQVPTASFLFSPTAPVIDQQINFNAAGSTVEPGHRLTNFDWNFGDGSTGGGQTTTHAYHDPGTYQVTLVVTDDAGRQSAVATQSVTVGSGDPVADFTFNPSAPRSGQQVTFDASPTTTAPGRTIVSFSWGFGDGGSGTGRTVTHTFTTGATPTTYNVLLTVTDSSGKTSSTTKPITINP